MKIGIVGLGLIGGSMAKSIKHRTGHEVYGLDLDRETMTMARMCGAIDGPLTEDALGADRAGRPPGCTVLKGRLHHRSQTHSHGASGRRRLRTA